MNALRRLEEFTESHIPDYEADDQSKASYRNENPVGIEPKANYISETTSYIQDAKAATNFANGTTIRIAEDYRGEWKLDTWALDADIKEITAAFSELTQNLSFDKITDAAIQVSDHLLTGLNERVDQEQANHAIKDGTERLFNYRTTMPEFQNDLSLALANMVNQTITNREANEYISVTIDQAADLTKTMFGHPDDASQTSHPKGEDRPQWLNRFSEEELTALADESAWPIKNLEAKVKIARITHQNMQEPDDRDYSSMTQAEAYQERLNQESKEAAQHIINEIQTRDHDNNSPVHIDREKNESMDQWAIKTNKGILHHVCFAMRDDYTSKYGFPIITDQAIQWIAEQTNNAPMIEIGAGNGYLSKEMRERGIDVIPTDPSEVDQNHYRLGRIEHVPIEKIDGIQALEKYPEHSAIWSWPEPEQYVKDTMQQFSGKHLVYIGEYGDGCTGPQQDLYITLEGDYRENGRCYIPSYPGNHDNIYVMERIDYEVYQPRRQEEHPHQSDHISTRDLNNILTGKTGDAETVQHILDAANSISGKFDEGMGRRTDSEIYIDYIDRATHYAAKQIVSDAMRYAGEEPRSDLLSHFEQTGITQEEWAEQTIQTIRQNARNTAADYHTEQYGRSSISSSALDELYWETRGTEFLQIDPANDYLSKEMDFHGFTIQNADPSQTDRIKSASIVWAWPSNPEQATAAMANFQGEHLVYIGDPTQKPGPDEILANSPAEYRLTQSLTISGADGSNHIMQLFQKVQPIMYDEDFNDTDLRIEQIYDDYNAEGDARIPLTPITGKK